MDIIPGKPINILELTTDIKKVVPELAGIHFDGTTLTFRRLSGVFSQAESDLITATLNSHDSNAIETARQARRQQINQIIQDCDNALNNWASLTNAERLEVLRKTILLLRLRDKGG